MLFLTAIFYMFCIEKQVSMCQFHQFCILTKEIIEIMAPFMYNVNIRVCEPKS